MSMFVAIVEQHDDSTKSVIFNHIPEDHCEMEVGINIASAMQGRLVAVVPADGFIDDGTFELCSY